MVAGVVLDPFGEVDEGGGDDDDEEEDEEHEFVSARLERVDEDLQSGGVARQFEQPHDADQWRTEGGGAEGAIRPGRHFERGGKKGKKGKEKKEKKKKREERRKRKKERKKNMEEACDYSKTKMEHLSCGALCTHKLASWRPCLFWYKRVFRITCFCIGR